MKTFLAAITTPIIVLFGVSLERIILAHNYWWLFILIPSLIYISWYFYKLLKS